MSATRVALLLTVAGALLAPQAGADTGCNASCNDEAFIGTLNILGVGTQYTDASKIAVAHQVCARYDEGFGDFDLFAAVQQSGAGLTSTQSAEFVGASVAAYCPQYDGYVPSRVRRL